MKIPFQTTSEQLLVLAEYYREVKNYVFLNDLETIKQAAKRAEVDQGVFDLFEMFAKDKSIDFRNEIIIDLEDAVMDYSNSKFN